jgi:S-adenosyl-L-methionine hydrolase (adenosine-forming)
MRRRGASGRRPAAPRPSGVVTLLTDFGLDDPYVAIVKGTILGINPAASLIDLTHTVPPQDVRAASLALDAAYRFFPRGTVHLAVVDPGVGGERRPLAALADGHYFVAPDNGLLGFCLEALGARAVALTNRAYYRARGARLSRTFHARDIFGPVAAHCSLGVPLERFGRPVRDAIRLTPPPLSRAGRRVVGQVLLVDRFGNLLTNVRERDLPGPPAGCVLDVGGARIAGIVGAYGDRAVGGLGAVIDSSGRIEIFVREGSARTRLRVGPGATVSFSRRSSPTASRTGSSRTGSSRTRSSQSTSSRTSNPPRSSRRRPTASRSRPAPSPSSRPASPSSGTPTGSR